MARKLYACENPACSLGEVGSPGSFTGGISKEQAVMLTGQPEDEVDAGAGVCPNCGKQGKEVGSHG